MKRNDSIFFCHWKKNVLVGSFPSEIYIICNEISGNFMILPFVTCLINSVYRTWPFVCGENLQKHTAFLWLHWRHNRYFLLIARSALRYVYLTRHRTFSGWYTIWIVYLFWFFSFILLTLWNKTEKLNCILHFSWPRWYISIEYKYK